MAELTEKERDDINKIAERWKDSHNTYCKGCMYNAIRHWDRNMDEACHDSDEENERPHPGRWDGDFIAKAPKDIWTLLLIIFKLDERPSLPCNYCDEDIVNETS